MQVALADLEADPAGLGKQVAQSPMQLLLSRQSQQLPRTSRPPLQDAVAVLVVEVAIAEAGLQAAFAVLEAANAGLGKETARPSTLPTPVLSLGRVAMSLFSAWGGSRLTGSRSMSASTPLVWMAPSRAGRLFSAWGAS